MNQYRRSIRALVSVGLLAVVGCSSGATDTGARSSGSQAAAEKPPFDPTVARTPQPSKSLTLAPDWQPPAPTRSRPARPISRVKPAKVYGVPSASLGAHPSDAELGAVSIFANPLRPVPGASPALETEALAAALREDTHDDRGIAALERFTAEYPSSRWAPAIHLNMGSISYSTGYFQDALTHWKAAWELAKAGEDETSKDIANLALANYAKMNSRLGRMTELESILKEAEHRTLMGDARVKIEGAAEGLWSMHNRPGRSFMCGPYALLSVAEKLKPEAAKNPTRFLERHPSPLTGFSVPEVQRMSSELGLQLQIARRDAGASMIIPAVVHWKVGHFGAIIWEDNGSLLLKDPTFNNDTWLSHQALDTEATGYFLVPAGPLPSGWHRASVGETAQLFGKGDVDDQDPDDTGDPDPKEPDCGGGGGGPGPGPRPIGMAVYHVYLSTVSLQIEDTPVSYRVAVGPEANVQLAYSQREADQPTTLDFTNFGPQFVSNWVSYLTDNTTNPSANISLRKRSGGGEVHSNYNSTTLSFGIERKTGAVLHRLSANTYKKAYPDGREEFYEHYIGTSGTARRVLLSRVADAQGNEVVLDYDTTYPQRIHQLVDASGLATVFHYDYPSEPYLVTSIEDPYGRESTFTYTLTAGKVRLQSSQDPDGITSSFVYNASGEIVSMTTPYGTTRFELSSPFVNNGTGLFRYVEITDPLGQKERIEYNRDTNQTGVPYTLEYPRPNSSVVAYAGGLQDYRNTFYWDKLAMKLAPGNYLKAHRYHWVHLRHPLINTCNVHALPRHGITGLRRAA